VYEDFLSRYVPVHMWLNQLLTPSTIRIVKQNCTRIVNCLSDSTVLIVSIRQVVSEDADCMLVHIDQCNARNWLFSLAAGDLTSGRSSAMKRGGG
jgi:hypothetical protein